jgi:Holliday junction resolvase RusA-like endonuclease
MLVLLRLIVSRWFSLPLNAQPWTTGRIGVGKKDGHLRGTLSPDMQLKTFQEAVREYMENVEPLPPGKYMLTFYIWREIEEYQGTRKRIVKHQVDATNLQKALEDALQGNLIGNDRDVAEIRTVVVEQERSTVPYIVIKADSWPGLNPDEIPDSVWSEMDEKAVELSFEEITAQAHSYHEGEDIF